MLSDHTIDTPEIRPQCTEPACLLKQEGMCREMLANCLVRLLAGEPPEALVTGAAVICPRPQCVDCALKVINGSAAFFTDSQWKRLDQLGRWHHRRQRRRARFWH